jgi:hypothetical protein
LSWLSVRHAWLQSSLVFRITLPFSSDAPRSILSVNSVSERVLRHFQSCVRCVRLLIGGSDRCSIVLFCTCLLGHGPGYTQATPDYLWSRGTSSVSIPAISVRLTLALVSFIIHTHIHRILSPPIKPTQL